jgi:serine/threonine protein phosphatase PrpC
MISAVLVEEKNYSIDHVGDSRIYLLRPGDFLHSPAY